MKKLLKIALLLCFVSGQVMGTEAELSDGGGDARAELPAQDNIAGRILGHALMHNLEPQLGYMPFKPLQQRSTIIKGAPDHLGESLFTALHGTHVGYSNNQATVDLTALATVFNDDKISVEVELSHLKKAEAKRWNASTHFALGFATAGFMGIGGYLAYRNRESLNAKCASFGVLCKNWFNKKFVHLAEKTQ